MMQVSLKKYGKTSPSAFGLTGRKTIAIVRSSGRLPPDPACLTSLLNPTTPLTVVGQHYCAMLISSNDFLIVVMYLESVRNGHFVRADIITQVLTSAAGYSLWRTCL